MQILFSPFLFVQNKRDEVKGAKYAIMQTKYFNKEIHLCKLLSSSFLNHFRPLNAVYFCSITLYKDDWFTFNCIFRHFVSKWQPSINWNVRISSIKLISIQINKTGFINILQNSHWQPLWMSENHY